MFGNYFFHVLLSIYDTTSEAHSLLCKWEVLLELIMHFSILFLIGSTDLKKKQSCVQNNLLPDTVY